MRPHRETTVVVVVALMSAPSASPVTAAAEGAWRGLQTPELPRAWCVLTLCYEGVQVRYVDGFLGLVLWKSTRIYYFFFPPFSFNSNFHPCLPFFYSSDTILAVRKTEMIGPDYVRTTSYLNGLIGSCDESNKQRKHHVDEERDEGVQINLAKQPHQGTALLHLRERHEHVIPVNEGE